MAYSPDHSLAPASGAPPAAPSGVPSAAPSGVPSCLRPMSAVPVAELPPLKPLPTNDPYSPVATGQALFCAVFNVTFSTLLAWLAAVPQHLIAQVRQAFASHSSHSSPPSHPSYPSLSERILLACRSLYSLLRVYHTFSSYWDRVTPHQLGLLSRASQAIKAFSGQTFDFSCWADLARRPARSYYPSSSFAPSPDRPLAPSVAPHPPIRNPKSAIRNLFPEWPFTALTAYNASFTMAPGRLLAQVCHDLARITQSPSPSPSPSQSDIALSSQSQSCSHSQSQSTPSIPSMGSIGSIGSIPSIGSIESIPPVAPSPVLPIAPSPVLPTAPSHVPPVPLSSSVPPAPLPLPLQSDSAPPP